MTAGFERNLNDEERNFYKKNIKNAVNLQKNNITLSGDLSFFYELEGIGILKNYVEREYNEDGTSLFWENPGEFEFNVLEIWGKCTTTREDRIGRIKKYNEELKAEELEKKVKIKELEKKYSIKEKKKKISKN